MQPRIPLYIPVLDLVLNFTLTDNDDKITFLLRFVFVSVQARL